MIIVINLGAGFRRIVKPINNIIFDRSMKRKNRSRSQYSYSFCAFLFLLEGLNNDTINGGSINMFLDPLFYYFSEVIKYNSDIRLAGKYVEGKISGLDLE